MIQQPGQTGSNILNEGGIPLKAAVGSMLKVCTCWDDLTKSFHSFLIITPQSVPVHQAHQLGFFNDTCLPLDPASKKTKSADPSGNHIGQETDESPPPMNVSWTIGMCPLPSLTFTVWMQLGGFDNVHTMYHLENEGCTIVYISTLCKIISSQANLRSFFSNPGLVPGFSHVFPI